MADHESFAEKLPYKTTPLNIRGAHTTPFPPKGFDPMTASPKELVHQGLLLRRPGEGDPPQMVAAYKKIFSRPFKAEDRIVPHLVPQIGKTHNFKGAQKKTTEGGFNNNKWSGAVIDTGTWGAVTAEWVIPTVSKPKEAQGTEGGWNSSSWIGIDGFANNDVLQIGVEQKVSAKGVASYVAWVEWYVDGGDVSKFPYINQTNITNFPVSPGQTVDCSVQYVNKKTAGLLQMINVTTNQHFTITLEPPTGAAFNGTSAEWIMEAPDGGEPTSSLPKFTSVDFKGAFACSPDDKTSGNPQNGDVVNIVNAKGTVLTAVTLHTDEVIIKFIG
jgi:Peptidase A4 family